MYSKYVLYYKFTDNMQDTDHMVCDQRVQNVTSHIHDNQRLLTGNISSIYHCHIGHFFTFYLLQMHLIQF